jgi:hypothetical protein
MELTVVQTNCNVSIIAWCRDGIFARRKDSDEAASVWNLECGDVTPLSFVFLSFLVLSGPQYRSNAACFPCSRSICAQDEAA